MKEYKFFYHFYKQYNCMSVHFKGFCYKTKNVECNVPCSSKWRLGQPILVMEGKAKEIKILQDKIIIF